ncbi:MAG: CDP-diacylglycerol--serine O-phosphatidyltransferase [Kordiimonadaceae bacterium]|nr:CDP-diacylglycerol--serine O-phosphatidyltransferase [Kordiimonadaceae bacterium]
MAGLTSIKFALAGKWELAVAAVLLAGVFDGLDGTVARLLNSASRFGAELDSLSDVVAFGVAPSVILYLWVLEGLGRFGWATALIYAIAMALRLARFNSRLEDENEPRQRTGFLTGVPAPMGAALMLVPMMMDFGLGEGIARSHGILISCYVVVIAILMVSVIPTVSLKAFRVPREWFVPVMLVIGGVIAGLFARTWIVFMAIAAVYIVSLPITFWAYKKRLEQKKRP